MMYVLYCTLSSVHPTPFYWEGDSLYSKKHMDEMNCVEIHVDLSTSNPKL